MWSTVSDAARELVPLIRRGRVILIGEPHGTFEFPALVAALAAYSTQQQITVLVGIEQPRTEQAAVDTFLASDGAASALRALTDRAFWHRPRGWDDGRSGTAVKNLLCSLCALRSTGRHMAVCAFDLPWIAPGDDLPTQFAALCTTSRDEAMADTVLDAVADHPEAVTIVLAGEEHARIARARTAEETPMGAIINTGHPDVVALVGHNQGGTIRATTPRPGKSPSIVTSNQTPVGVGWFHQHVRDGYHGWVNVGVVSASPPLPPDRAR